MNNATEQIFVVNSSVTQSSNATQRLIVEVPPVAQVNLENVEDFSNVCRTCATITEFVIPIFEGEGLQNNLAEKIHKHLPIQVTEEDALPRAVCYQCAHTLLAWHELVACCEQADAALRTRLQQVQDKLRQETKQTTNEIQSVENKQTNEFEEIAEFVVSPGDPPQYISHEPDPPPTIKTCDYCKTEHSEDTYKDHLISAHYDLLFHCDECDTYVARKDFFIHMSFHAVQYAANQKEIKKLKKVKKKKNKDENENTGDDNSLKHKTDCSSKIDNLENETQIDGAALPGTNNSETLNDIPANEFSDQSDTEFDFGPLPESVFEAIEDSQDSQTESNETNPGEDNEPIVPNESSDAPRETKQKKHKKSRTCPICAKVYNASSSYFYHMKYFHKRSKEHECGVCGRKFGTKGSLNQHASIHTGECEFECKECGKRFRSKASLYIHEQTHNGVKTYGCTQCQISFRWRTHLMRHMKRHSAEKAHVCSTCGRGFNIRCDLLRHARTHSAGSYSCDKCGAKFAQIRYLKVHMDKKHSAVSAEQHPVT